MTREVVYLKVKVVIGHRDKEGRKRAIAMAKDCTLSRSATSSNFTSCEPVSAVLIPKRKREPLHIPFSQQGD